MKSIRETITKAIENSQVDHIVTQQSADELIEELLAALEAEYETPQEMIDRYFAIASEVELAEYFKVIVAQDIMLDITDTGSLDMGKGRNVELNRLRAAVDLNVSGFSFNQLDGRMARVTVKQDQDRNDPSKFYARVKAVGHA